MKKKILFISASLGLGGSEKCMTEMINRINFDIYDVTILTLMGVDIQVAVDNRVKIINGYTMFDELNYSLKQALKWGIQRKNISYVYNKLKYRVAVQFGKKHISEYFWGNLSKMIPDFNEKYDVAIGYGQGIATYFCVDKIKKVKKKILWVNTDLEKANYNIDYIRKFYEAVDFVVTDSFNGQKNQERLFPSIKGKVKCFPNLIDDDKIKKLAEIEKIEMSNGTVNILTVGRLVEAKGIDMAVKAAQFLKKKGYSFTWYIVGEGNLRRNIESQILEENLQKEIILVGAKKNPYPWFKACDIYVQTSIYEGSCMTINEAKVFYKPIVTTDFPAAFEKIENEKNGIICEMTPESIALSVEKLLNDEQLRNTVVNQLKKEEKDSRNQMQLFYELCD